MSSEKTPSFPQNPHHDPSRFPSVALDDLARSIDRNSPEQAREMYSHFDRVFRDARESFGSYLLSLRNQGNTVGSHEPTPSMVYRVDTEGSILPVALPVIEDEDSGSEPVEPTPSLSDLNLLMAIDGAWTPTPAFPLVQVKSVPVELDFRTPVVDITPNEGVTQLDDDDLVPMNEPPRVLPPYGPIHRMESGTPTPTVTISFRDLFEKSLTPTDPVSSFGFAVTPVVYSFAGFRHR